MSEARIASRYAKSLLELSKEKKALEKVVKDIEMFAGICESNRDFVLMLRNPIINHGHKLSILKKAFEKNVHKITNSFFEIVTRKNREMYLPEIAQSFLHQYNVEKGIVESTVITASPLSAALKKDLGAVLKTITGDKKVDLKEVVDENLIGGFVLRVGDKQIDDSVSSRLREIKLQLNQD